VERAASCAILFLVACGTSQTPGSGSRSETHAATARPSAPHQVLGIDVRKPWNPAAFVRQTCSSARAFAFRRGSYSIVADDVLFSVPHEHQDTTAVLAALDSFTVCVGETRELNATAVVTLSDSVVGHAHIFWPDQRRAPDYDRMLTTLTKAYGEPYQNERGVQFWAADSIELTIGHRGFFNEGTSLDLADTRTCDRFERLVHRHSAAPVYLDAGSNYCWVEPKRLPPDQIFPEGPVALADSDLTAAGIAYGADSSDVRRILGPPASVDSAFWVYPGLRILFTGARVLRMELTTPEWTTIRGLRAGDRLAQATALYGAPCTPASYTAFYAYCRTVGREPDVRGILLQIQDGVITHIHVGAVFTYR
jgi:hypothetical protein